MIWYDQRHGPLPSLLLALTFCAGLADAAAFTGLGHVFVANMTGNVVILGLALGGDARFSLPAALAVIAAFLAGAVASGWLRDRFGGNRGMLLASTVFAECVLVAIALGVTLGMTDHASWPGYFAFSVPLALAMGAQNASGVRMGVSSLSSTVLTTTLGGLAAESPVGGGGGGTASLGRRGIAVVAMLLGAACGVLLLRLGVVALLATELALLAIVAVVTFATARGAPAWTRPV